LENDSGRQDLLACLDAGAILEFLDTHVLDVSIENCVSFLDPLIESWGKEQRIVHRDRSKYDLGSIVFNQPLLSAEWLHFEKNHARRHFYSVRSMVRRLGLPKTRGDLIVWIANLAGTFAAVGPERDRGCERHF
jgi:hypothetical protein